MWLRGGRLMHKTADIIEHKQLEVEREFQHKFVMKLAQINFSQLTEREIMVLSLRYGFGLLGKPQTIKCIAETMNLKQERIVQIENKALAKLAVISNSN
jgi:DNA-directed RNA polymerase sigma subunit (sigma70/sigma32)